MGPYGCCTSCHYDDDMGYDDMLYGTFRGREYHVCCRMAETLRAATPKYWMCDGKCSAVEIGPHRHYGRNVIIPLRAGEDDVEVGVERLDR